MGKILIIGSGHSGGMAAIILRQKRFFGSITIIGDEKYPPYERPPLSKDFLYDQKNIDRLFLKKGEFYTKNNINLILGTTVEVIDREKKYVTTSKGLNFDYDILIIATGSKIVELENTPMNDSLSYLRTIEDSNQIASLIKKDKSLTIIGSGYIGLEIAATAAKKRMEVTIIEAEDKVMSRVTSSEISNFLQAKHEEHGVKFIFNTYVSKVNNKNTIILGDSSRIKTDVIVIGIGIIPDIDIAYSCGLDCDDGINVDENCITSDCSIYAIGDCTSHPSYLYKRNIRLESVHNAVEQAKTAVAHIMGSPKPYNQVPWFWSQQYDIKLQTAGICSGYDESIIKGSLSEEKFSVLYFKNDVLIAIDTINSPSDFIKARKIIEQQTIISNPKLQDLINNEQK